MERSFRKQFWGLLKKDFLLEFRNQYTFYGILLYVVCITYLIYLTMGQPEEKVWNGLFWLSQLFVCVNAIAKSFLSDSKGLMLYYYTVVSPKIYIWAKMVFNVILMLLISGISALLFLFFLENPLSKTMLFFGVVSLGSISLSLVFVFLSALAAKAEQQASLIVILGFPLIVPQLLLLSKISTPAFSDVVQAGWWELVILLVILDLLIFILSGILFPFLWKE